MRKINKTIKLSLLATSLMIPQFASAWVVGVYDAGLVEMQKVQLFMPLQQDLSNVLGAIKVGNKLTENSIGTVAQQMVADRENADAQSIEARARDVSLMRMQHQANTMPTLAKCIEVTQAGGLGRAYKNSDTAKQQLGQAVANRAYSNTGQAINNVTKDAVKLGICSSADIVGNNQGCENQKIGEYANGDISFNSVLKDKKNNSKSLSPQAIEVSAKYVSNNVDALSPARPKYNAGSNSDYQMTMYKVYQARVSPARDALVHLFSERTTLAGSDNNNLKTYWNSAEVNNKWTNAYGNNTVKPEVPSMSQLVDMEVLHDYTSITSAAKKQTYGSEVEALTDLNKKLALNNYLLTKQIELAEYQLGVSANQLLQSVSPITRDSVDSAKAMK